MRILLLLAVLVSLFSVDARAQTLPKESSVLNYRIIGFTTSELAGKEDEKIEIASGYYTDEKYFDGEIIITQQLQDKKIVLEVPKWGHSYTWRVTGKNWRGKLHHFTTMASPLVDACVRRLRITKDAEQYQDGFVFCDASKALLDMKGNPVWFLTNLENTFNVNEQSSKVRDIKLTPQGTITFMIVQNVYEIGLGGKVLWKKQNTSAADDKERQHFHHEFTRLENGHYMIMGDEELDVRIKKGTGADSNIFYVKNVNTKDTAGTEPFRLLAATVLEYDEAGKLVWSVKTSKFLIDKWLVHTMCRDGSNEMNPHGNGFYFDERSKNLYISFKNISRILKVSYPDGNLVNEYGEKFAPGMAQEGKGLFSYQHNCKISKNGNLYLFDNNVFDKKGMPKVLVMKEPVAKNGDLETVWEYQCTLDEADKINMPNRVFSSGGSASELPDGSFLVNMGTNCSKIFIVNPDKKVTWSAIAERWNDLEKNWKMVPQYRSSFVKNRSVLEQMIWTAEAEY